MNRTIVLWDCTARTILGLMALTFALALSSPAAAQVCTGGGIGWIPTGMTTPDPPNCLALFSCYQPLLEPVVYVPVGGCDPVRTLQSSP